MSLGWVLAWIAFLSAFFAAAFYSPWLALLVVLPVGLGAMYRVYSKLLDRRRNALQRQRELGLPDLEAWAEAHGWRVHRTSLDVAWSWRLLHLADDGPHLTVSGVVDGIQVDVVRVPWHDTDADGRPEEGVATGIVVPMPGHEFTTFRRAGVRCEVRRELLIAVIGDVPIEVTPDVIPKWAARVVTARKRHMTRVARRERPSTVD